VLMDQGIVPLMGLEAALVAIKAAQTRPWTLDWRPVPAVVERETVLLSEAAGKAMLAKAGVPVPRGMEAKTLNELIEIAPVLSGPLALKGLGFAHKSEAGAVRLGLASLEGQSEMPGATGYLAEEMVTGAIAEVLLGLRRDPVYGATLTLGMGGVTAELLADTVTLILPVSETDVLAAMKTLRLWPLLHGYRGRAKADIACVAKIAANLCTFMLAHASIEEIEVNPLIVRASGAVAVDALVRVAKEEQQ
jgi:acetate---CoA ligase (ADP-forming)